VKDEGMLFVKKHVNKVYQIVSVFILKLHFSHGKFLAVL